MDSDLRHLSEGHDISRRKLRSCRPTPPSEMSKRENKLQEDHPAEEEEAEAPAGKKSPRTLEAMMQPFQ